jgi:hypothetical protein
MARTLSQILIDANAFLDLDASEPTNTELSTRVNFANQAVQNAAAIGQLSEFHSIYTVNPSTLASISLPANYREMMTGPRQLLSDGSWSDPFNEIKPLERYEKTTSDKYCYVLGNPSQGYTAVFNGLEANATLSIDFQRFPSGMATLSDICELPDPMVVVTEIEALVLESRSDDRFPIKRAESNQKMQAMYGREMKTPGGGINSTRRQGTAAYRIG